MLVSTDISKAADSSYATLPSLLSLSTEPLTPLVLDIMHRFHSLCINTVVSGGNSTPLPPQWH